MATNEFLSYVIIIALLASFCLILLKKWCVIERMQVKGCDLIAKMANCNFCLSFWICVILSAFAVLVSGNGYLMFVPLFATPITRFLL